MLVNKEKACVALFNMQLELIPLLHQGTSLLNDCCWMADVANTFALPTFVIEHKKLGASSQALRDVSGHCRVLEKCHFDFTAHGDITDALDGCGREQVILAGAESHVCILQSAAGLLERGKTVFVIEDATSARNLPDHQRALARMDKMGVHLITKEMFFFECIRQSEFPEYVGIAMKYLDGRYIR